MTGMQGELRDRIVGSTAHMYVYKQLEPFRDIEAERRLVDIPGVVGSAPAMVGYALLQAPGGHSEPAQLKGIDPAVEVTVTNIESAIVTGSLDALTNRPPGAHSGIILGADLAEGLRVGVGDIIWAYSTAMTSSPMGLRPRQRPLEVV